MPRSPSEDAPKRDRAASEEALVAAVGEVLARDGFVGLGVNAIARAAGCDKVLIYRYFDGLDGLLAAYAKSAAFFPTVAELVPDPEALRALPIEDRVAAVFRRYLGALRARPRTLEILASEVVSRSPLHGPLEEARERLGLELISAGASDLPLGLDFPAVAALITGGVHYLLLRARFIDVFGGVSLQSEAGWERLGDAVEALARGVVRDAARKAPARGGRRRAARARG
jgi:AcrR family transcriptional regulator